MDSIDVIIPVYNTPLKLLRRSVKSAKCSKGVRVNIIIVDNNSTNKDTINALYEYSKKEGILLLKCIKKGASCARNIGIENAKSRYLFFLDSDDVIDPGLLKNLIDVAKKNDCDVVKIPILRMYNERIKKDDCSIESGPLSQELAINYMMNSNVLNTPCSLYKTSFILSNSIRFDDRFSCAEDLLFNAELLNKNAKFWFLDIDGYYYEKNNYMSTTMSKDLLVQCQNIVDVIRVNELVARKLSFDGERTVLIREKTKRDVDNYYKKIIKGSGFCAAKKALAILERDSAFRNFKDSVLAESGDKWSSIGNRSILFGRGTYFKTRILSIIYMLKRVKEK